MEIKTFEVDTKFRIDDVVDEHKKIFYVIHQSMLDESIDWESGIVEIDNIGEKVDPYTISQLHMNKTKLYNLTIDGFNRIIDINFHNTVTFDNYFLIKLFNKTELPVNYSPSLIYFPQTNQAFLRNDEWWDERVLLSHEYVFVVPLIPNHSQM